MIGIPRAALAFLTCTVATPLAAQRAVEMTAADGFVLHGSYYAAEAPGPGALLVHQCDRTGPETGLEGLAGEMRDAGLHVLLYDARGFGRSRSGAYPDFRSRMSEIEPLTDGDAEAAYAFLARQPAVAESAIAVLGASCGARRAVGLARSHQEVRALVFLSGMLPVAPGPGRRDGPTDRAVLAIYAEDDPYEAAPGMRRAYDLSVHPESRHLAYKGTDHGASLLARDAALPAYIARWVIARLTPR